MSDNRTREAMKGESEKVEYGCAFCKHKLAVVPFIVRSMNTKFTGKPKSSKTWCGQCDPRRGSL